MKNNMELLTFTRFRDKLNNNTSVYERSDTDEMYFNAQKD